ncbi:MAG: VOC family protein, partial [Nitrospinota bacterium]
MAGLNHVHLMSRDVDAMAKFFSTHFGAELYERKDNVQGAPNLRLRLGESRIYIRGVRPTDKVAERVEGRPLGLHHIGLDVDDVEAQLEKMRAAGVKVIQDHEGLSRQRSLLLAGVPAHALPIGEDDGSPPMSSGPASLNALGASMPSAGGATGPPTVVVIPTYTEAAHIGVVVEGLLAL